jgi:Ca2+-binding EF-hand superfamily protein
VRYRKLKLHELFAQWLLNPENSAWVNFLLADVLAGKRESARLKVHTQPQTPCVPAPPGSPVSRLIHHNLPFSGSPRLNPNFITLPLLQHQRALSSSATPSNRAPGGSGNQSPPLVLAPVSDGATFADYSEPQGVSGQKKTDMSRLCELTRGNVSRGVKATVLGLPGTCTTQMVSTGTGLGEPSLHQDGQVDLLTTNLLVSPMNSDGSRDSTVSLPHSSSVGENIFQSTPNVQLSTGRGELPPFYFSCGKGASEREAREWALIGILFAKLRDGKDGKEGVTRTEFSVIVSQVLSLPSFFAPIVFDRVLDMRVDSSTQQPMSQARDECNESRTTTLQGRRERCPPLSTDESVHESQEPSDVRIPSGHLERSTEGDDVDIKPMNIDSGAHCRTSEVHSSRGTGVTEVRFQEYYLREARSRSLEERLLRSLLPEGETRDYLTPSDFKVMLRALLMCHQGLSFLHATPEFQLRYSETVVERIFFSCSRTHSGRLTLKDMKRSRLLHTLLLVDAEEDINRERKYFSYEHFYVLYCRFWELDVDHDLQIDREDLMRYGGHSLTYRIVDRIFGGYARRLDSADHPGFMSYTDFIWFCLSEEDKTSETAVDYWFRCVDMDGDGLITMYDMEYFYKEQLHRMECFGHEPVQIRDILCQLLDMVKPNSQPPHIKRSDLKGCRLAGSFFNVLFNLNKFFALEARDPLQIRQEHATPELTDWDRFAALEYLRLSAEEEGEDEEVWEDVHDAINPTIPGEAPF